MKTLLLRATLLGAAGLVPARAALVPAGFNEPNVIVYGRVTNNLTSPGTPAYYGALAFTVTPAGGTAFTVTTPLSSLASGSYSYQLKIPVEKVPGGFRLDGSTLAATSAANNSSVAATISGAPAAMYDAAGNAYSGTLAYSEVSRGALVRIDLQFNSSYGGTNPDSDNNGLDDAWEILHFGHIGVDPNADPDGDGESNLAEFQDGGDPLCYEWDKWLARSNLDGAAADPAATPPGQTAPNLLRYALGIDPGGRGTNTVDAHLATSIVTDNGKQYLALTVQRPGYRTCGVDYVVESSGDLLKWSGVSGTDVVTMTNEPATLKVRDTQPITLGSNPLRRFLRLRAVYKP